MTRQKTSVRMQAARDSLDAFEAQETATRVPPPSAPRVALVFWLCVVAVGVAVYLFAAWIQRP